MSDDALITEALEKFDLATKRWTDNFQRSREDIDFGRLGNQWPDEIKRAREQSARPMLTINRVPSFIRQVVNDSRQNKPSIKIRPVDGEGDLKTAEIIQGMVRNIEANSDADVAYDTGVDNAASGGIGFVRIDIDYAREDSFDMDVMIKPVENIFSVTFDPETKAYDSSDWNYAFLSEFVPEERFKRLYPKASMSDFKFNNSDQNWYDSESGVRVAEWWNRTEYDKTVLLMSNGITVDAEAIKDSLEMLIQQGIKPVRERKTKGYRVMHRLMTGSEVIKETAWVGQTIPIVPVYGEVVNYQGRRIWRSLFRDAKDPQRMLNYWRTTATELVALSPKAPYIGPEKAFEGNEELWANANTESYAYLPYKGDMPPQRQQMTQVPAAEMQQAISASDDMKAIMGLFDASMGERSNETSGRAILARQRQGNTSTFHFIDNLTRSIRGVGRILVEIIPHIYDQERMIRVLGEDGKPEMVAINKPEMGDDGIERVINDLTVGKYDVIATAGPSYSTLRQESSAAMMDLVQAFPDAAPVLADIIAKTMDWPDADKVAERLAYLLPPQVQEAEKAKQAEKGGEDQVKAMLSGAQEEIAKRDQQIEEMGAQMEGATKGLESKANELQKAEQQITEKVAEVKQDMADLDMAKQQLEFKQKQVVEEIQLTVQKAQVELQKIALAKAEHEASEKPEMETEEVIEEPQIDPTQLVLAQAMQQIAGLAAAMAAPKTVSMMGADGQMRVATVQPQAAPVGP